MPPHWLEALAWTSLVLAFLCAYGIVVDIAVRDYRQRMWIMNVVWPVTGLYLGAVGLWAYVRYGRLNAPKFSEESARRPDYFDKVSATIGVSHCGAGCTLGDIAGAWLIFATGWTLLRLALPAEYAADFLLAFALGIAFPYWSIAPARGLGLSAGCWPR